MSIALTTLLALAVCFTCFFLTVTVLTGRRLREAPVVVREVLGRRR